LVEILKTWDIEVTQATLPRDFSKLGVVRAHSENGVRYVINQAESGAQVKKLISFEILNVNHNESTVVRTLSGRAQMAAYFIDRIDRPEILGTVSRDDTVLLIPNTHRSIPAIVNLVKQMMHEFSAEEE